MAESTAKKVVAVDDLKIVIDDIYSRLSNAAEKNALVSAIDLIYKHEREIQSLYGTVYKKRVMLEFSKWDDSTGRQSIEDENIKEDSVVLISLPLNTTDDAAYEFNSAGITAVEQVEGKITLKYTEEKPKRNFLIDLCIM